MPLIHIALLMVYHETKYVNIFKRKKKHICDLAGRKRCSLCTNICVPAKYKYRLIIQRKRKLKEKIKKQLQKAHPKISRILRL